MKVKTVAGILSVITFFSSGAIFAQQSVAASSSKCSIGGQYTPPYTSSNEIFYKITQQDYATVYKLIVTLIFWSEEYDDRKFEVHNDFDLSSEGNPLKFESMTKELVKISLPMTLTLDGNRVRVPVQIEAKNLQPQYSGGQEVYTPVGAGSYKITSPGYTFVGDGLSFVVTKACFQQTLR